MDLTKNSETKTLCWEISPALARLSALAKISLEMQCKVPGLCGRVGLCPRSWVRRILTLLPCTHPPPVVMVLLNLDFYY